MQFFQETVKPLPEKTKKVKGSSSNGFTFEFGGGTQQVKALVARKRPPTKKEDSLKQENASLKVAPKSMAIRRKAATKPVVNVPKSMAFKRKVEANKQPQIPEKKSYHSDNDSDVDTYINMAKPTAAQPAASDLMLNICTTTSTTKTQPKLKLSKQERMQQKYEARKGNAPLNKRTLSHKEIHSGIRKFSQNPNQKPRASDIFEQNEREAKEALKTQTGEVEPTKEPVPLGDVDRSFPEGEEIRMI